MSHALSQLRHQVIWTRLVAIVEEQAQTLMRTAFSTTVRDAGDLSAALFDLEGRLIAEAVTGTPGHVNSMAAGVRHFIDRFPLDTMEPGDHFITNDPWLTAGHLHDVTVVSPAFHEGRIVGLFGVCCHQVDIGGLGQGPDGRSIYEEGIQIPLMKLASRGVLNEQLLEIVCQNVRTPLQVRGDILSYVTSNNAAIRRLSAMLGEFAMADLQAVADTIVTQSLEATFEDGAGGGAGARVEKSPSVITDDAGRFAFRDVEAGSYRIAAARNGYVRKEFGQRVVGAPGRVLTLAPGESITGIALQLLPAGNVSGVVRDASGEPAPGLQVQLLRPAYGATGQRTLQASAVTRTNDRGEYRLYWVTPGRYYLAVQSASPALAMAVLGERGSSNEVSERKHPTTFYPGTIEASQASIVDVEPGAEVSGIDLFLPHQALLHVRGRVIDPATGRHPPAASVTIVPRGAAVSTSGLFGSRSPYDPATGTFDLAEIPPGSYWVRATVTASSSSVLVPPSAAGRTLTDLFTDTILSERQAAQVAVEVSGSDVDGVVLSLSRGVSIRGRLMVEGRPLASVPDFERLRVTLRPAAPGTLAHPVPNEPMNSDGAFTLEHVLPGEYVVTVQPLPRDYYIKDARLDQADALNQPVSIRDAVSGTLSVLLSPRAGGLDGMVTDDRRRPVSGIQAVLVPDRQRDRSDLYRTAVTDQAGRFTMGGIAPGDYRVFAWEAIEPFAYFDADFLRQAEPDGHLVRVAESSRQTVEVKVIPAGLP